MPNSRELARSDIKAGSKSFSFASFFFGERERQACWQLYAWCRRSDDAIDNAASRADAVIQLDELEKRTKAAFRAEVTDRSNEHPWSGLRDIAVRYSLPEHAALDMLRGFSIDLGPDGPTQSVQMRNWDELEDYCYCVAGTVGLLMCPIMGVTDAAASQSAMAMGKAMQLTNIARDVKEDFERARIYLPLNWLIEHGVQPNNLLAQENRSAVFEVVRRMLVRAEDLYSLGESGLHYLPWRAAWAVQIAASVYREIGRQVLARGADTDYRRVVVSRPRKLVLFISASCKLFANRILGRSSAVKGSLDGVNVISS